MINVCVDFLLIIINLLNQSQESLGKSEFALVEKIQRKRRNVQNNCSNKNYRKQFKLN